MSSEAAPAQARNQQILRHAIEAFGSYGVRGASLREIARKAGVSLTLIHHHYGNKPSLVWASTDSTLKAGSAPLSRLKHDLTGARSAAELVKAWTRYLIDAFGTDSKLPHLRLLQRLRGDPDTDADIQQTLDAAGPLLRACLHRLYPRASEDAVDVVLQSSRAALVTVMLEETSRKRGRAWRLDLDEPVRRLMERFVTAAIDAAMENDAAATPVQEVQVCSG